MKYILIAAVLIIFVFVIANARKESEDKKKIEKIAEMRKKAEEEHNNKDSLRLLRKPYKDLSAKEKGDLVLLKNRERAEKQRAKDEECINNIAKINGMTREQWDKKVEAEADDVNRKLAVYKEIHEDEYQELLAKEREEKERALEEKRMKEEKDREFEDYLWKNGFDGSNGSDFDDLQTYEKDKIRQRFEDAKVNIKM